MSTNIAYAVVQCSNYSTPNVTVVSKFGISAVVNQDAGLFIVTFEDSFFSNVPAVQVTAMFNGNSGSQLNSVTTSDLAPSMSPANQMVHACILWTTPIQCQIRTAFSDQAFGNWLSFSITAVGVGD